MNGEHQQAIDIEMISVDDLDIRVAYKKEQDSNQIPLLIFNGIGANLELFLPFMEALEGKPCIIFDVPGVGESTTPNLPRRFPALAKLSREILDHYAIGAVDVIGVSWGGALAQVFALKYSKRCHRLILAATSTGSIMVPGKLSVLVNLVNPKRYFQKGFINSIADTLYGGVLRDDPEMVKEFAEKVKPPKGGGLGYYWQLFAGWGWTSIHWIHKIKTPTLILAGNDDPIIPLANAHIFDRQLPNSRLEVIDCGHLLLFTQLDKIIPIIQDFFAEKDVVHGKRWIPLKGH